ncbi:MAG TPA: hypothetical protein VFW86_00185 [Candidatus Limnocylindrales bacterium]|nr:hypothetical protein [Candidatus Limnocylindrales bacterium]
MRAIRTILGLLAGLLTLGAIASAVAALMMRRRLRSSGSETDDEFDLVTIFDSLEFRCRAATFRRGSSLTWYGGGTIDLREATLDPAGAELSIRAIFGGLRLVAPATWRIETAVATVFGGVDDARSPDLVAADGPSLRITGFAVFGGVAVLDDAPDLDTAWPDADAAGMPA